MKVHDHFCCAEAMLHSDYSRNASRQPSWHQVIAVSMIAFSCSPLRPSSCKDCEHPNLNAGSDVEQPFLETIREQIGNGSLTGGAGGQEQLVGLAFALLAGTFGGYSTVLPVQLGIVH